MPETSSTTRRKSSWVDVLPTLTVVVCLALVAGSLLSPFVRIETAQGRHQLEAAVSVKILNKLQKDYAANHAPGFACQLQQLKTAGPPDYHGFDPNVGTHYQFSISECRADASGRITQYQITAEPQEHGNWAFCSDQSGVIWHDENGSVSKCVLEKRNGFKPEEDLPSQSLNSDPSRDSKPVIQLITIVTPNPIPAVIR